MPSLKGLQRHFSPDATLPPPPLPLLQCLPVPGQDCSPHEGTPPAPFHEGRSMFKHNIGPWGSTPGLQYLPQKCRARPLLCKALAASKPDCSCALGEAAPGLHDSPEKIPAHSLLLKAEASLAPSSSGAMTMAAPGLQGASQEDLLPTLSHENLVGRPGSGGRAKCTSPGMHGLAQEAPVLPLPGQT